MNQNKKDILIWFGVFSVEILLFYYFWKNNIVLTAFFLIISAFVMVKFASNREKILYLTCFFLGPVFDLILVPRGVWSYANPSLFRIPIWLPFTYGLGTLTAVKIGNAISNILSD